MTKQFATKNAITEVYYCAYCAVQADDLRTIWEHAVEYHPVELLNQILEGEHDAKNVQH